MKYFSEITKKTYDTAEDCLEAEKAATEKLEAEKKLAENRKVRAKEIEDAQKHVDELIDAFIKDYGSFHMTLHSGNKSLLDDVLSLLWEVK